MREELFGKFLASVDDPNHWQSTAGASLVKQTNAKRAVKSAHQNMGCRYPAESRFLEFCKLLISNKVGAKDVDTVLLRVSLADKLESSGRVS